jgi:hypothetical protein
MSSKASFAHVMPLRAGETPVSRSVLIRGRRTRRTAESSTISDTLLALGLLIMITIGLVALRAALWVPPLDL